MAAEYGDLQEDLRQAVLGVTNSDEPCPVALNDEILRVAALHLGVWHHRSKRNPAMTPAVQTRLRALRRAQRRHPVAHPAVRTAKAAFKAAFRSADRRAFADYAAALNGGNVSIFHALYHRQRGRAGPVTAMSPDYDIPAVVTFWTDQFRSAHSRDGLDQFLNSHPAVLPSPITISEDSFAEALSKTNPLHLAQTVSASPSSSGSRTPSSSPYRTCLSTRPSPT
jgi:hypothetical protein